MFFERLLKYVFDSVLITLFPCYKVATYLTGKNSDSKLTCGNLFMVGVTAALTSALFFLLPIIFSEYVNDLFAFLMIFFGAAAGFNAILSVVLLIGSLVFCWRPQAET